MHHKQQWIEICDLLQIRSQNELISMDAYHIKLEAPSHDLYLIHNWRRNSQCTAELYHQRVVLTERIWKMFLAAAQVAGFHRDVFLGHGI